MVLGSGIRDSGSGKNLFWIPDPGVKKAPDPGSRIRIRNTVHYEHFLKISEGSDKKIIIVTNGLKTTHSSV
jgi:hypothetical protein